VDIRRLLSGYQGVARLDDLVRAGATRRQVASAVRAQEIFRVSRGCYALSDASQVRRSSPVDPDMVETIVTLD